MQVRAAITILVVLGTLISGVQPASASATGVYTWGFNTDGEVGNSTTVTPVTSPFTLPGFGAAMAGISGPYKSVFALKADGSVWGWGHNDVGELGQGANTGNGCACLSAPVAVKDAPGTGTLTGMIALYGGTYSNFALTPSHTVYAWGYNASGQLGDNSSITRQLPVLVQQPGGGGAMTNVSQIASGQYASAALIAGNVYTFGTNAEGELGTGTVNTPTNSILPVEVKTNSSTFLSGVIAISMGFTTGYALKSDGTVWAWGDDAAGQLGDTAAVANSAYAVQVPGIAGATAISANRTHALALIGTNVWGWGYDGNAELGQGGTPGNACVCRAAVEVKDTPGTGFLSSIASISAGGYFDAALSTTGTVWTWGSGSDGEMGDGSTGNQTRPKVNATMSGVSQISAATQGLMVAVAIAPMVTGLNPTSGISGTSVVITGTGLTGATVVAFGANNSTYVVNGATQITATAPANASLSTVHVVVTAPGGTSPSTVADQFTYYTVATVTVTAGLLAFAGAPANVTFPGIALTGNAQAPSQTLAIDISDLTGVGTGWNLQMSGTVLTGSGHALASNAVTVQGAPAQACDTAGQCVLATNVVAYPWTMSTSAQKVFSAAANTGMGNETVTPTFEVSIPGSVYIATYTATWTFTLASGP